MLRLVGIVVGQWLRKFEGMGAASTHWHPLAPQSSLYEMVVEWAKQDGKKSER
jgi:hypothetical protein